MQPEKMGIQHLALGIEITVFHGCIYKKVMLVQACTMISEMQRLKVTTTSRKEG